VSNNSKDILGYNPSYFLDREHGWSERIHPDDQERVYETFRNVINDEDLAINEYRFKTKAGSYIWLRDEIKLIEDTDKEESVIYGSSIDITDRKKAEIALRQNKTEELKQEIEKRKDVERQLQKRLSYEKAISKCSNILLENSSSEALRKSLKILQEVTDSDRVYLYKNQKEKGALLLDPVMEVTAPGIETVLNAQEKINYSAIPWWHMKLSNNEIIHSQTQDLPEPERTILQEKDVESVLVIPIMIDEEWYGYIGFAEVQNKRVWHDNEISLLQTAAGLIAAFKKRKKIEQSLISQRNYTQTILDSLPSIYLLMDENLNFVQWNSNAERYTGYNAEELSEKSAFDLIVPEEHEKLEKATQRVREEEGEGSELTLLTKSGKEIPYFWHGYYIELDREKYFLCVGVDITLQKQTEKELMDEKRFNEALIESLPGIFYMVDSEGNYHRWNQNFVDELGYTSEELQHMTPADFYSEQEYQRIRAGIEKVFETGEAEIETTIITKDNCEIPYYLTGKLFTQEDEDYLIGVGYDITEQVEAREKIRKSEELFRNLFLKAPAAIVMVDPDNKIQNVNKSFEDLFGYSEEEIEGRDIDEVIVPEEEYEDAPKMPSTSDKYAMDSFHKEARRLTKGGTLVDVFVAAIPVFVDDEPLAGFGMYIDITEQKKYEEEIYTSLKEKHVLLQEIHHRVKNNLAVVSGLLQLQIYETDDPVIQETLRESENRIQTMALIHEKLYNSQNLARISCDSYIGELVETIRTTIGTEKNIAVKTDIADVELNINKAVPFALLVNEVVTNSFKHAFKDRDRGNINIDLQKSEGKIHAHIRDDGSGLPDGFSTEEKDSLGMTLIDNFARQLEADWELGSDDGTYIDITFDPRGTKSSTDPRIADL
jgi:PAS domain S-box-containing protein